MSDILYGAYLRLFGQYKKYLAVLRRNARLSVSLVRYATANAPYWRDTTKVVH